MRGDSRRRVALIRGRRIRPLSTCELGLLRQCDLRVVMTSTSVVVLIVAVVVGVMAEEGLSGAKGGEMSREAARVSEAGGTRAVVIVIIVVIVAQ